MTEDLIKQLRNSSPSVRRDALLHCLRLPREERTEDLCAVVAELLGDENAALREIAARALPKLGCIYASILPTLTSALMDRLATVREKILETLQYYPPNELLKPILNRLLSDPDPLVRIRAARTHWRHVRDQLAIKQNVLDGLASDTAMCAIQAAQLATDLFEEREELIEPLFRLLNSHDGDVRGNAFFALSKIATEVPTTMEWAYRLKEDAHPMVKYIASQIIRGYPTGGKEKE